MAKSSGEGHRPGRGGQQCDDALSGRRVALIEPGQRRPDPVVYGVDLDRHEIARY